MKIPTNKVKIDNVETGQRPVSAIFAILIMLITSCSSDHLINNSQYRTLTEKTFSQRKVLAAKRDSALFTVFKQNISETQSEALKFLYAFMPLSDLADYNGDFFLANVNIALKARSETSWGKDIPEEIFLHYVLPCRINNENLDSFRIVYYDELLNRVRGKTITDAALEINHWCHEKVNYQPSDIRTSAPLSTVLSARGRCGEESTLTVAALRTVGIPARQVYTPRWAHSDDNHAWVEIWHDGDWYYTGACEPEPVLDRGWFTEPARRAMLVHTKSFGAFTGNENIIIKHPYYTDVNNLAKYAVTKNIFVKVLDQDGNPVEDAQVEYQLYNYAEFYPLAVVPTDQHGVSNFETGLGDLLIWAHKDDKFDFRKISVSETDTLILTISEKVIGNGNRILYLDLDVPIVRSPLPGPSKEATDKNSERIKAENIIRQKYIDSWSTLSKEKTRTLSLMFDSVRVANAISRSMGNYREISAFLSETPDSLLPVAMSLLEILPDKDLRDTRRYILSDHLLNSSLQLKYDVKDKVKTEERIFLEYVLNPRIANELLVAWRHYFQNVLPSDLVKNGSKNPLLIVQYLNDNISIADNENYYQTPLTPIGVNDLKISDRSSRAVCFVAICRSLGIPSRLEPGSNVPQYFQAGKWIDIYFSDQKQPELNKGYLKLHSDDKNPVPEYYIQFTLARFDQGRYNTLEYDFNKKISDFREELPLPPGHYIIVTGNRLHDSRILSSISFFDLAENEHKTVDVKIRKDVSEKKIFGKIDLLKINSLIHLSNTSQACVKDKGLVIIWIDPEKEPTRHIFNDLPLLKNELDAWGGQFIFLTDSLQYGNSFYHENIKGLPANTSFGIDNKMNVLKNSVKFNISDEVNLPVVIVADKDGNIFFLSAGYCIGIGEQILKTVK